jgi:AcrR family transcriptional regulator
MDPELRRDHVIETTIRCIESSGLRAISLDDIADAAQVSRATIYRYFPDGRDQLISEAVTREVSRFFGQIESELEDVDELAAKFRITLMLGAKGIAENQLLQQLLSTEAEELLPELDMATTVVQGVIRSMIVEELHAGIEKGELRPDLDVGFASDYLGRMLLSCMSTAGQWDLSDPVSINDLVDRWFMAGIRISD